MTFFGVNTIIGQSSVVVFSENFDNATSTQPWAPYFTSGWFKNSPLNVLQAESGKGKVLKVNFPTKTVADGHGIGNYRIPLDSAYKELYFSWEYYLSSDFDYGWADGTGGGKFFGGFSGGSMTAIPNNDDTDLDGWASIIMFQKAYSTTYNYFKGADDFTDYGWPDGTRVTAIGEGQWRRVTVRLKINDGDLYNGIYEVFDNDVLVYQKANAKIVNADHPEFLIEHIYLNSFFGGSGDPYVSTKDQYMEFDNLIAFYYPKGSSGYRSGASESGRVIQVPKASSYHPIPPNKFTPTTYTDANGTINSHCGFYQPVNHTDNFETSTIQVNGATSLNIKVTKFSYDAGINYSGYKQTLKIYQGTGSGKVLKQTYQNGILTAPGSVVINGNSATIEWQAGQGSHNGFSISYTSNGTGSGKNFSCKDCVAEQGIVTITPPITPTDSVPNPPINLVYKNLTDRSVSLQWTDNSDNESWFEIERSGPNSTTLIQTFKSDYNTTTFESNGLIGNSTYTYKIRAYNSTSGYSSYSNSIQITTNYALPTPPSSLLSTAQTVSSVSLKWSDNSNIEQGYIVERSLSPTEGFKEVATLSPNITSYTDNSLNASTNYYYKLRAFNQAGFSNYTSVLSVATAAAQIPAAPSGLYAAKVEYTTTSVIWTDNATNETGFDLERSGPNDFTIKKNISLPFNTTSYTDNELVSNGIYQYHVRAKNNDGISAWSNIIELQTPASVVIANNPPTINDQQFTVRESSFSDNFIGRIVSNDPDAGQNLNYSIISGNTTGLFTLNNQNGDLSATSDEIFGPGTLSYELVVQVSDDASEPKSATAKIAVNLVGKSTVVYIDPENTDDVNANGSIYHPYDSWNDVTLKTGYSYLQKKGTTATVDRILIGANNITLGAYGEGNNPIISSGTNTYIISGFEKSNITIQNLVIKGPNAVSAIYFLGSTSNNITIEYCTFVESSSAIRVVDGMKLISRYNTFSVVNEGIYSSSAITEVYYNIFKNIEVALNITSNLSDARIYNNVFLNNGESVTTSYANLTLYNNIFYLTSANQNAVTHQSNAITSDHNIFYPEQAGFIEVNGKSYASLDLVQQDLEIDLHSFNSDPKFIDIYNENFGLESMSPAINSGIELNLQQDFFGEEVPISGVPDIGIAEYAGQALSNSEQEAESQMSVYPNPSSGIVNVFMDTPETDGSIGQSQLSIMDMNGKYVFSKVIDLASHTIEECINLTDKPGGLYYVVLQIAGKIYTNKIILN